MLADLFNLHLAWNYAVQLVQCRLYIFLDPPFNLIILVSSNAEDLHERPCLGFSFLRYKNLAWSACNSSFSRYDQDGKLT